MHGFNPLGLSELKSFVSAKTAARQEVRRGFRNLLGPPSRLFTGDGLLPGGAQDLEELLKRLNNRCQKRHNQLWVDCQTPARPYTAALEVWENPAIPSGYTYLLQLIAHDLVASTVSFSSEIGRAAVENTRSSPLTLQTIYGGGPQLAPDHFEFDSDHAASKGLIPRTRLRLSPREASIAGATHCPHRDLGRGTAAGRAQGQFVNYADDEARKTEDRQFLRTEVMAADSRNDSHALLSQLTVLFHLLHNTIIGKLLARSPADPDWPREETAWRRFLCARTVVALIYRHIIRKDVLRRLLHPAVFKSYEDGGTRLDRRGDIPLEFSHAAFRCGHAMVRSRYRTNDPNPVSSHETVNALRQALRNPAHVPISRTWHLDWRLFFEVDPSVQPNYSRRIGPDFAGVMFAPELFTTEAGLGLPFLDSLSAAFAGIWSVPDLMKKVIETNSDNNLADILITYSKWQAPLRDWLGEPVNSKVLSDDDKRRLANDPPLSLFVLFEAAHAIRDGKPVREGGGLHLGPLGSVIVAETIFGALDQTKMDFEMPALRDSIRECCKNVLRDEMALEDVAIRTGPDQREIREMADVIRFLAESGAFAA